MKTKHNKAYAVIVGYCIFAVIVLVIIASLASCNTSKRASRLIDKADRIDNTVLPAKCAEMYPTKDSVHETIQYKEGKPVPYKEIQFVRVNCDSLISAQKLPNNDKSKPDNKPSGIFMLPCPPCDSFRIDSVINSLYDQKTGTADKVDLTNKLNAANQTIAAKEEKLNIFIWVAGVETALIVLFIAWKIFKPKVL